MLRQQVTDFLDKGRMETTITRAKEIRPIAEKMITLGKKNTLASRRAAAAFLTKKQDKTSGKIKSETGRRDDQTDVLQKLFNEIAPKYASRPGGYCRIIRLGPRRGDGAEMAVIELVEEGSSAAPASKSRRLTTASETKPAKAAKPAPKAEPEAAADEAEVVETTEAEAVETPEVTEEAVTTEAEAETEPSEETAE